jgi:hypothetical protein
VIKINDKTLHLESVIMLSRPSYEKKAESDDGTHATRSMSSLSDNPAINITVGTFDPNSSDSSSIQFDDEETRQTRLDAKILHKENPTMTYAECFRFRKLRTIKKARKKLRSYREWQKKYIDDIPPLQSLSFESDKEVWEYAVSHSLRYFPDVNLTEKLPWITRIIGDDPSLYPNLNSDADKTFTTDSVCGKRILHFLPMLIDTSIASLDLYALSFAVYFYLTLDRYGLEEVMVVCDARHGRGWHNPSALSLVPFAKLTAKHMDWFPQRLDKFYAYPVPLPAKIGWSVLKRFLRPVVVAKVHIHWGNSSVDACPPECFGENYFEQSTVDHLESERISEFR